MRCCDGSQTRCAQALGYAERDPTADIEGFDAAAKAAILAMIAFDTQVVAGDVYRSIKNKSTLHLAALVHDLGKGYGEDAMRILMRLAFEKLRLNRLSLRVFDFNHRAIACYEKCGFKREGVLREDHFAEGRFHDVIVMAILRSEYDALRK